LIDLIKHENISIVIDKINFEIISLKPKNIWTLDVKALKLENFPSTKDPVLDEMLELLSIQSIEFRSSTEARAEIFEIALKYRKRNLNFSVTVINFESPNRKNKDFFTILADSKGMTEKAISVNLEFNEKTDLLGKFLVTTAPITLNLSRNDILDETSLFVHLNFLLEQDKKMLPHVLKDRVFEPDYVVKIINQLRLLKKKKDEPITRSLTKTPSLAMFEADDGTVMELITKKLSIKCVQGTK